MGVNPAKCESKSSQMTIATSPTVNAQQSTHNCHLNSTAFAAAKRIVHLSFNRRKFCELRGEANAYALRRLFRVFVSHGCVVLLAGASDRRSCSSVGGRPVRIGYRRATQDSGHDSGARLVPSVGDRV